LLVIVEKEIGIFLPKPLLLELRLLLLPPFGGKHGGCM